MSMKTGPTRSTAANEIIKGLEAILKTKIQYEVTEMDNYTIISIMLPRGYEYKLSAAGRTFAVEIRAIKHGILEITHDILGKFSVTIPFKSVRFLIAFNNLSAEVFKWTIDTENQDAYIIVDEEPGETYIMLSDVSHSRL